MRSVAPFAVPCHPISCHPYAHSPAHPSLLLRLSRFSSASGTLCEQCLLACPAIGAKKTASGGPEKTTGRTPSAHAQGSITNDHWTDKLRRPAVRPIFLQLRRLERRNLHVPAVGLVQFTLQFNFDVSYKRPYQSFFIRLNACSIMSHARQPNTLFMVCGKHPLLEQVSSTIR